MTRIDKNIRGVVYALIGGVLWGFSGSCAQLLFSAYGVDPLWATSVRMMLGGVALSAITLATRRSRALDVLRRPRHVARLVVFAAFGLFLMQFSYLMTINFSNAATATVLEYIGPMLVVVVICVRGRRWPTIREVIAIVFVIVGVFLLATHGDAFQLALSPLALTWGLIAGVSIVTYTLLPSLLMERFGSSSVLSWAMLIGGGVLCVYTRPWTSLPALDAAGWAFLVVGLTGLGTIVAYLAYFQGIKYIGATRTSLLCSVELISAAGLAVFWLHTQLAVMDYVGLALVISTVFLLAKADEAETPRPKAS